MQPTFIMGLIAPEFGEPILADYLSCEPVLRHVRPFLGDELRLGWVALCAIKDRGYECRWHRDFGKQERDGSYEVEMQILKHYRKNLLKWHLALVDDPCLWIVPGSQQRYRTEQERQSLLSMQTHRDIPGMLRIKLKRGQTVSGTGT